MQNLWQMQMSTVKNSARQENGYASETTESQGRIQTFR